MTHGGHNQHQVARKKMENQPEPKPGISYSVRARPLRGLAGRYPHLSEVTLE